MKDIAIDPITPKEFHQAVRESYDSLLEALDMEAVGEMELQEALFMFFLNGFHRGCMAMTDNPDLQETIHMMAEETKYQLKE